MNDEHGRFKVVFVTQNLYGGGCERVISTLSNYFVKNNVECSILTEYDSDVYYELDSNIEVVGFSKEPCRGFWKIFLTYFKIRKYVKCIKPHIVLAMPEKVNLWTVISLIGTNIPVAVSIRNDPNIMPKSFTKRLLRSILYPFFVDGVVFQTKEAMLCFHKLIRNKGKVLRNPINIDQFPKPYTGIRKKIVVGVGRLEDQKNFSLLIKAFSKFSKEYDPYILKIYGEGPKKDELVLLANKLAPGKVQFVGKSKTLLSDEIKSKMFVLSSDYEGMPNVLLEFMAIGVPVISTDYSPGGVNELVASGVNGLVIEKNSSSELYDAMVSLEKGEGFCSSIDESSLKIKSRFSIEVVGPQWLQYLKALSEIR